MQVFVLKNDLATNATTIYVHANFPDLPWIDRNTLGTDKTPLSLPESSGAVTAVPIPQPGQAPTAPFAMQLSSNWRSQAVPICQGEAQRRILESFSDYMQRNANNDFANSVQLYGSNTSTWPADAKSRLQTANTGWTYIYNVRQQADALESALPSDPTNDSNWPAKIPVVYIPYAPVPARIS